MYLTTFVPFLNVSEFFVLLSFLLVALGDGAGSEI